MPPWARDALLRLDLLTVEAADVLAYPIGAATSLRKVAEAPVPLAGAPEFRVVAFRGRKAASSIWRS